jgi:predicted transglutaminase-like cysteine proteinase
VLAAGDDLVVKNFFIERLSSLPNSGRIAIALAQAKAASAAAMKKYCTAKMAFVADAGVAGFEQRAGAHCQNDAPVSHDLPSGPVVLTAQCAAAYSTVCP